MDVITSFDIRHDCWSGAADRIDVLTDDQIDLLEQYLEDMFGDDIPTMTEVNDFIWFEDPTWVEWLGFTDLDELEFFNNAMSDVYRCLEDDKLYEYDDIVELYNSQDSDFLHVFGYNKEDEEELEEFYETYSDVDELIDDCFEFVE